MKTFAHANQNKFDWIHLVANNGIYDIYKKEKKFHKHSAMMWYHPAVLSFDNHADLSSFILLNEFIQYLNTYNTHLIAKGDVNNLIIPTWKNLKDVYKYAHASEAKIISHTDILILSHPHYTKKYTVEVTGPTKISTKSEIIPVWVQDEVEDMALQ